MDALFPATFLKDSSIFFSSGASPLSRTLGAAGRVILGNVFCFCLCYSQQHFYKTAIISHFQCCRPRYSRQCSLFPFVLFPTTFLYDSLSQQVHRHLVPLTVLADALFLATCFVPVLQYVLFPAMFLYDSFHLIRCIAIYSHFRW